MKKFVTELGKNINLEMNLPLYANYLMDLYNKRAAVEFAMDYYTYQGMINDYAVKDAYLDKFTKEFNHIVEKYVNTICVDEMREEGIRKIDLIRNNVYNVVEVLAAYADIFSRYEYVINRCEYVYKETDILAHHNDEEFTRQVMQYIFSDEDNAVINSKICEVIAELPLRLTKNKFFELLSDGMSVYSKTDKKTIDDFVYVLRSSSMLWLPDRLDEYEELYQIYNEIKDIDYTSMEEDMFYEVEAKLKYAAEFIEHETNLFMILQGLINKAYALIIAAPYVDNKVSEVENARYIIENINKSFYNSEYLTLEDDITDRFVFLEGVPETLQNVIQSVEYVLDNVKNNHLGIVKSIMADTIYQGLFLCEKLLADSLFVDLSESDEDGAVKDKTGEEKNVKDTDKQGNEEYLEQEKERMIADLMEFFKSHKKPVNRSVMALILSRLPVFFNNITEVQDYVYNALSNCTNKAEKAASVEIIKSLMEN